MFARKKRTAFGNVNVAIILKKTTLLGSVYSCILFIMTSKTTVKSNRFA